MKYNLKKLEKEFASRIDKVFRSKTVRRAVSGGLDYSSQKVR